MKGFLVAIGGKEDKGGGQPEHLRVTDMNFFSEGVLEEICKLMPGPEPVVEVITTASEIPEDYFHEYKDAFRKLGVTARHLNVHSRESFEHPKVLQRISECSGVMISGGDQTRLTAMLGGTQFLGIMKDRLKRERFVIGGTSAGATCMSDIMMVAGSAEKGNIKGEVSVGLGLGLTNGVLIDTHFDTRGRFGRLAGALASQPSIIGIGLGEDTGVIMSGNGRVRAIGSDSVYILDASQMTYTNIAEVKKGKPITIGRLGVYLISRYDEYDLDTRTLLPLPSDEKLK